jgi:D-alanyl-lipoteichoic acid acyltransferase DltB (MBOAT superfamily)
MLLNIYLENIKDLFIYNKDNPMLFNSGAFLLLFTLFISIYAAVYKSKQARTWYLFAFSIFFYYKASGFYFLILLLSVFADYWIALILMKIEDKRYRLAFLIFSLCLNLGLLFYFKYTNFLVENFANLTNGKFKAIDIFLPIGISFYTFQTISYVVDVYRKVIPPTKSFIDYAFYMTFFPHLVAGPIVRARDFLPQINKKIHISKVDIGIGLFLIIKGLIKKAVIADYLAQYNDIIYGMPSSYSGFENLMALYGYTIQIYCDFSGYSDMAIGLARLMGFRLCDNFNSPYISSNITEFWRRWHMSLSSWLRDYLYISMGGNRHGKFRQNINLFLTMLIGGLWHGASWKFVVWGGLHGIGLIVHKLYLKLKLPFADAKWAKILGILITFHFVAILWVFFRADSYGSAIDSLRQIFCNMDLAFVAPFAKVRGLFLVILAIGIITHFIPLKYKEFALEKFTNLHFAFKFIIILVVIQLVLQLQSENVTPFIYFQF